MTTDKAPDLPRPSSGHGSRSWHAYPSKGVHIGPAWQAMWEVLRDAPGPIWLEHLGRIGAAAGSCRPATAWYVLDKFRRAGILDVQQEMFGSRWRNLYALAERDLIGYARVTPEWLAEWCEKSSNPRLKDIEFP